MSIQLFDHLFSPKSLALIGATSKEESLGRALMENIINAGYEGIILPINPKYSDVLGFPCFSNVDKLSCVPDLAIICTPPKVVPEIIEDLGKKGTKAVIVISAGFGEGDRQEGRNLQIEMLKNAKTYGIRIVGPNCFGIINTATKLNATFSTQMPKKGDIAFISQSGAILISLLEWAHTVDVGFSKLLSVGGMSDLNFADYLEYLNNDIQTKSIVLYVEAITDAKRFLSIAKKTVMTKPIIVIKSGRVQAAATAIRSHSGALAGSDAVYEAAFQQAGLCRLYELQDIYDLLLALHHFPKLKGNGLTILTNGGGVGILATDTLIAAGGHLSPLSLASIDKLNSILPPAWSQGNPVDIIGDASPERYVKALNVLMNDSSVQTILLMHCPTALSPMKSVFEAIINTLTKRIISRPDIFVMCLQQNIGKNIFSNISKNKIPIYQTPERAVRAFIHLLNCENKEQSIDDSPQEPIAINADVSNLLKSFITKKNQEWLDHYIIHEILTSYGIPIVKTLFASTPTNARMIARKMKFPLVLKIASKDIVHKSDVGGIALHLNTPEEVEESARKMLKTISAFQPQARIEGFILQPMIPLNHGFELFLGGIQDLTFGPVVIFGAGGKAVEVIKDKALALAPLTPQSAFQLIEKTRIYGQLKGYRDQESIPLDQLIDCLVKLSYILVNHPEIAELDINPLLADTQKILVLDTRMRLSLTNMS
jgi:acetyltransferase